MASAGQLPEGMDPNSSYNLEIKLIGNPKTRKADCRCYSFIKSVDSDTINFKDLVQSIVDECPPGYQEIVTVQYYDEGLKCYPQVETDQQLMAMFEKYVETKVVTMFILYSDPAEPQPLVTEWPDTPSSNTEHNQPSQSQTELIEDNYLVNPLPENEHVGVDEEYTYLCNEIVPAVTVGVDDNGKGKVPEDDIESESELESDFEEELPVKDYEPENISNIEYDQDDPPMDVGTIYPNIEEFKLALAQHAIKRGFEYNIEKADAGRYRVYCSRKAEEKCPWRIHAVTLDDDVTIKVKINPSRHQCTSTRRSKKVKNATKFWVCKKVKDWLIEDATLGAKELQRRIKEHHKVKVHYKRVYMGKDLALKQLYGDWDSSLNNLFRFKAEMEKSSPGSFVVIDHHKVNDKNRFKRLFFAMKPCIDGFLSGCRPYLAIDSTFLTGRFKGQLATAVAVDGHNWMFPVVFSVIDSETNDNWIWFMHRLKEAIETPLGLTICTDAGQAIMAGVKVAFPHVEHRECMWHLVQNFKKRYHGKVFDDHLWAVAYSWHEHFFEKHWAEMVRAKPAATTYLRTSHTKLWTRSQFSTLSKVDYVTNNLALSFNNWIKQHKSLNLDDLMDKIRQMLMIKWEQRRKISRKFEELILPHIIKNLKEKSWNLDMDVVKCSDEVAEVTVRGGTGFRFAVRLRDKTCTCREWQVSGIPCLHAIAFITSLDHAPLENYVDLAYSVQKFRAAYAQEIPALPDKSQWPKSHHDFFMHPPLLKPTAGRRKSERYKSSAEGTSTTTRRKGQHQYPICHGYGHHWHNCKEGDPQDVAAVMALRGPPKKKKRTTTISTESSIVPFEDEELTRSMNFPPSQNIEPVTIRKTKGRKSDSTRSIRSGSGSGSNELEALSLECPDGERQAATRHKKATAKIKPKLKEKAKKANDSPTM